MLDYTAKMRQLVEDICRRHPAFSHIDPQRIAICFAQTRRPGPQGTHASIYPLRFPGGKLEQRRHGRTWRMPQLTSQGREVLYALFFFLPRFCDLSRQEKLITVLHELYHISPDFDGDVRQPAGNRWPHGDSLEAYDALMAEYATAYLAAHPPEELIRFLDLSFAELREKYGEVGGETMRRPLPYDVTDPAAAGKGQAPPA